MTTHTERRVSIASQTDHPLSAYGSLAAAAERAGFDAVFVYNDLLYQPAWLPLLEIARATHRVALRPAAVNPFTCHPVNLAGHAALIDEASGGRAYPGLARGAWHGFLGAEPRRPVTALREAFECVRHLIEHAVMVERDLDRACSMVDARMLRIGVAGAPEALVARLRPLVASGVQHLSFGPPLGPDPLRAVELLGREVLPALRP